MRFIATLLLMVTCTGLSWAEELFTADELRGIETQMAGVQVGATKVYTITRGDRTYNLELTANADGTYAVGGAGVPSGLLGALKFKDHSASFKPQGQQYFQLVARKLALPGVTIFDFRSREFVTLPAVVTYVLVTAYATETYEIIQAGPYDS